MVKSLKSLLNAETRGHSTTLIFTVLKSVFQTRAFGTCLGSQHLKVTLSTISTGVNGESIFADFSSDKLNGKATKAVMNGCNEYFLM